ncbi:MAG: hypothetical protein JKP95_01315 [Oceanicaulis sp.]|nr:hypothetical protein [Oceanicaulis sp.]
MLIAVGLPLFWTPLPFGLVLIAIGAALILSNSDSARNHVRLARSSSQIQRLHDQGRTGDPAPVRPDPAAD